MDRQVGVPSENVEVLVAVKHRKIVSNRNRADETVDQPSHGFSPATALSIQAGSRHIIR